MRGVVKRDGGWRGGGEREQYLRRVLTWASSSLLVLLGGLCARLLLYISDLLLLMLGACIALLWLGWVASLRRPLCNLCSLLLLAARLLLLVGLSNLLGGWRCGGCNTSHLQHRWII